MTLRLSAIALIAVAALGSSPAAADRTQSVHRKPAAPVTLTASAEPTATGWRVVVDATPTRDAASVEVEVAGRRTRFGTTAAKRPRRLEVPIDVAAGVGQDVVVVAWVGGRSKSVTVRVGAPAPVPAKRPTTIRIINGVTISEVR